MTLVTPGNGWNLKANNRNSSKEWNDVISPYSLEGSKFDLGIWQTYHPEDEVHFERFKSSCQLIFKNFPRFFAFDNQKNKSSLFAAMAKFDLVGFALMADHLKAVELLENDSIPGLDHAYRIFHSPRGFDPNYLIPLQEEGIFTIGVEKGVHADGQELEFARDAVARARERVSRETRILGARTQSLTWVDQHVKLLPQLEFYEKFISRLDLYIQIDFSKSEQSRNADSKNGRTIFQGLYENQVIEAQIAGAHVLGHQDSLALEQVAPIQHNLAIMPTYDSSEMAARIIDISNLRHQSRKIRDWAISKHSCREMARPLVNMVIGRMGGS